MTALCGLTFQFFFTHECEALKMKEIMDFLKEEGISPKLIQEVQEFSAAHPVKDSCASFFLLWKKSVGGSSGSTFVWKESIACR